MKIRYNKEYYVFNFTSIEFVDRREKNNKFSCSEKITRFHDQFKLFKVPLDRNNSSESDWIVIDVKI